MDGMLFGSMKVVTKSDYTDHILVNNGHNGVKLACDLMNFRIYNYFENDKISRQFLIQIMMTDDS